MTTRDRYNRQTILPEVGEVGQVRLRNTSALLVGAGGLGCPASLYLIAAGLGRLVIVDPDRVERSNLQRQVGYTDADVGLPKAACLALRLMALNPESDVQAVTERFDERNASSLLSDIDVVIDGTDNFISHFLIGDAAWRACKPLFTASVHRFQGQYAAFIPGQGPCHRCLFGEPPPTHRAPNCADAGVLGVLPGIIGVLQATQVLKFILGLGASDMNQLTMYNALQGGFRTVRMTQDPNCPLCAPHASCQCPSHPQNKTGILFSEGYSS